MPEEYTGQHRAFIGGTAVSTIARRLGHLKIAARLNPRPTTGVGWFESYYAPRHLAPGQYPVIGDPMGQVPR